MRSATTCPVVISLHQPDRASVPRHTAAQPAHDLVKRVCPAPLGAARYTQLAPNKNGTLNSYGPPSPESGTRTDTHTPFSVPVEKTRPPTSNNAEMQYGIARLGDAAAWSGSRRGRGSRKTPGAPAAHEPWPWDDPAPHPTPAPRTPTIPTRNRWAQPTEYPTLSRCPRCNAVTLHARVETRDCHIDPHPLTLDQELAARLAHPDDCWTFDAITVGRRIRLAYRDQYRINAGPTRHPVLATHHCDRPTRQQLELGGTS